MSDDYRVLPVPSNLRGPSGESNQIQVDGLVNRIALFHGPRDQELDWHIYFYLDSLPARQIEQHLRNNGESVADEDVANLYCELMVVDDRHRRCIATPLSATFGWKYDSADLTRPLRLFKSGTNHPAYNLARPIADEPGQKKNLSEHSLLFLHRGRIYMQGVLVRDIGHSPGRLEIHPPDSIAFAMGNDGRTLFATESDCNWPTGTLRWRVAWFANSSRHRVNKEIALKSERTTTWYLPLPANENEVDATPELPSMEQQVEVTTTPIQLWDSKNDEWYDSRGVQAVEEAVLAVDPRDNRRKLRVTATMEAPGNRGGIIVQDYVVRLKPTVLDPGFDN